MKTYYIQTTDMTGKKTTLPEPYENIRDAYDVIMTLAQKLKSDLKLEYNGQHDEIWIYEKPNYQCRVEVNHRRNLNFYYNIIEKKD